RAARVGMRFVVATEDHSGLGFALRLLEEGNDVLLATNPSAADREDPARLAAFERVGCGLVRKAPLADVLARRASFRDAVFLWDQNHSVAENELLRSEGFRVLGGGAWCDVMEH